MLRLTFCEIIGFEFQHHHALEDAKASGQILIAAINKTGLGLEDWLKRVKQSIDPSDVSTGGAIRREGNPEGALYGEKLVFTGALEIRRKEAADLAALIGCNVESGVTKKTTILVVGDQDVTKLAGKDKSAKHRKAKGLIAKGQAIRILRESDFKELVNQAEDITYRDREEPRSSPLPHHAAYGSVLRDSADQGRKSGPGERKTE